MSTVYSKSSISTPKVWEVDESLPKLSITQQREFIKEWKRLGLIGLPDLPFLYEDKYLKRQTIVPNRQLKFGKSVPTHRRGENKTMKISDIIRSLFDTVIRSKQYFDMQMEYPGVFDRSNTMLIVHPSRCASGKSVDAYNIYFGMSVVEVMDGKDDGFKYAEVNLCHQVIYDLVSGLANTEIGEVLIQKLIGDVGFSIIPLECNVLDLLREIDVYVDPFALIEDELTVFSQSLFGANVFDYDLPKPYSLYAYGSITYGGHESGKNVNKWETPIMNLASYQKNQRMAVVDVFISSFCTSSIRTHIIDSIPGHDTTGSNFKLGCSQWNGLRLHPKGGRYHLPNLITESIDLEPATFVSQCLTQESGSYRIKPVDPVDQHISPYTNTERMMLSRVSLHLDTAEPEVVVGVTKLTNSLGEKFLQLSPMYVDVPENLISEVCIPISCDDERNKIPLGSVTRIMSSNRHGETIGVMVTEDFARVLKPKDRSTTGLLITNRPELARAFDVPMIKVNEAVRILISLGLIPSGRYVNLAEIGDTLRILPFHQLFRASNFVWETIDVLLLHSKSRPVEQSESFVCNYFSFTPNPGNIPKRAYTNMRRNLYEYLSQMCKDDSDPKRPPVPAYLIRTTSHGRYGGGTTSHRCFTCKRIYNGIGAAMVCNRSHHAARSTTRTGPDQNGNI